MDDDGILVIRSFRVCFELERRLHKIDRWRIPLPYGVPLRGIAYAVGALLTVLICSSLPILGTLVGLLPLGVRLLALPVIVAYALTQLKVDGRSAHSAGWARLRQRLQPARMCAFRPALERGPVGIGPVTLAYDEGGSRGRPGMVKGPARVLLRYPAEFETRGRTLRVSLRDGAPMWRGKQITLRAGQRAVIR